MNSILGVRYAGAFEHQAGIVAHPDAFPHLPAALYARALPHGADGKGNLLAAKAHAYFRAGVDIHLPAGNVVILVDQQQAGDGQAGIGQQPLWQNAQGRQRAQAGAVDGIGNDVDAVFAGAAQSFSAILYRYL